MYWSLIRIYFISAYLSAAERFKRENVYSITFKSHESNLDDVINALKDLSVLNQDIDLVIQEQRKKTVIYALVFLENMS